jgi:predicted dehydrogenase
MLKIGIISPSDIAIRRFLPALELSKQFEFSGVAIANADEWYLNNKLECFDSIQKLQKDKALQIMSKYGGRIYNGYESLVASSEIDAIYLPLPPVLHYFWALEAIKNGKHLLVEKPFSVDLEDTKYLIEQAAKKNLALHENYAFCYHNQLESIKQLLSEKAIGDVRQIRTIFSFPYRGSSDFRYDKKMGGGALFDCAGYPVKLSSIFLGESSKITSASLSSTKNHEVDIFGSATMTNESGLTSQISFGMDNAYRCELEILGNRGYIYAPRIFTPPSDMAPPVYLNGLKDENLIMTKAEDQFFNSIEQFNNAISNDTEKEKRYSEIQKQAELVDQIHSLSKSL